MGRGAGVLAAVSAVFVMSASGAMGCACASAHGGYAGWSQAHASRGYGNPPSSGREDWGRAGVQAYAPSLQLNVTTSAVGNSSQITGSSGPITVTQTSGPVTVLGLWSGSGTGAAASPSAGPLNANPGGAGASANQGGGQGAGAPSSGGLVNANFGSGSSGGGLVTVNAGSGASGAPGLVNVNLSGSQAGSLPLQLCASCAASLTGGVGG